MPDRKQIDELTKRLLAEQTQRDEASKERARKAVEKANRRQADEATEHARELARFSELAPLLLETRQDQAELVRIETVVSAGLFGNKFRTVVENVPAWEMAAGYGTTVRSFKDGSLETDENYRLMLAADGRLLFGTSERKFHGSAAMRPKRYWTISTAKPPHALTRDCDLGTASAISQRIATIERGDYRGPLRWR